MKTLLVENTFKRDLKLCRKRGANMNVLDAVVQILSNGDPLPPKHRPHKLSGEWNGFWECHVRPDLLLIYEVDDTSVRLIRLGSHADLFH
jgi:mRNA interferase YafQ